MLSELSYQQLRFEGRPRRLAGGASGISRAAASSEAPQAKREEPLLTADESRLVTAALGVAGLEAAAYRSGPFLRRLPAVLRSLRSGSASLAARQIVENRELAERALDTLLIGHTAPFRDAEVFAELRERALPELALSRRGLRVWSVGCSVGVELLSVAALLAELGNLGESRLRGSDCRGSVIAEARARATACFAAEARARFPQWAACGNSPEFSAAVARIEWSVEDALADGPAGTWDVVLCRNVAIYLDGAAATRLWERLTDALAPGGLLITGKVERPPARLPLTRVAKCIYRREDSQ